jgi:hypothetical protein
MKVINDLRQLIRDNYDKIAEMPKEIRDIQIRPQPQHYRDDNIIKWITIYYKGTYNKVSVFLKYPQKDEFLSPIPFDKKLWEDFYNELKEVLNG